MKTAPGKGNARTLAIALAALGLVVLTALAPPAGAQNLGAPVPDPVVETLDPAADQACGATPYHLMNALGRPLPALYVVTQYQASPSSRPVVEMDYLRPILQDGNLDFRCEKPVNVDRSGGPDIAVALGVPRSSAGSTSVDQTRPSLRVRRLAGAMNRKLDLRVELVSPAEEADPPQDASDHDVVKKSVGYDSEDAPDTFVTNLVLPAEDAETKRTEIEMKVSGSRGSVALVSDTFSGDPKAELSQRQNRQPVELRYVAPEPGQPLPNRVVITTEEHRTGRTDLVLERQREHTAELVFDIHAAGKVISGNIDDLPERVQVSVGNSTFRPGGPSSTRTVTGNTLKYEASGDGARVRSARIHLSEKKHPSEPWHRVTVGAQNLPREIDFVLWEDKTTGDAPQTITQALYDAHGERADRIEAEVEEVAAPLPSGYRPTGTAMKLVLPLPPSRVFASLEETSAAHKLHYESPDTVEEMSMELRTGAHDVLYPPNVTGAVESPRNFGTDTVALTAKKLPHTFDVTLGKGASKELHYSAPTSDPASSLSFTKETRYIGDPIAVAYHDARFIGQPEHHDGILKRKLPASFPASDFDVRMTGSLVPLPKNFKLCTNTGANDCTWETFKDVNFEEEVSRGAHKKGTKASVGSYLFEMDPVATFKVQETRTERGKIGYLTNPGARGGNKIYATSTKPVRVTTDLELTGRKLALQANVAGSGFTGRLLGQKRNAYVALDTGWRQGYQPDLAEGRLEGHIRVTRDARLPSEQHSRAHDELEISARGMEVDVEFGTFAADRYVFEFDPDEPDLTHHGDITCALPRGRTFQFKVGKADLRKPMCEKLTWDEALTGGG